MKMIMVLCFNPLESLEITKFEYCDGIQAIGTKRNELLLANLIWKKVSEFFPVTSLFVVFEMIYVCNLW